MPGPGRTALQTLQHILQRPQEASDTRMSLTPFGSPEGVVMLGTNLRVFLVSATDDVVKVEVWDVVDKGKVHFLLNV